MVFSFWKPTMTSPAWRPLATAICCAISLVATSVLAQPAITDVSPRGLRIGATTTLTISGAGLGPDVRLVSDLPITSQRVLEGAAPAQVKIEVALGQDVAPGIYAFRLVDAKGISDRVMLGVDRLPQIPFIERVESTPVALSGVIAGETKLATTFRGAQGEELSVDLESRRLGGAMKPIVRLLDAAGKQVAYSGGREGLEGDARFTVALPADGEYRVELHDALFRAPPSPFRLKIGRLSFADAVFPPIANIDADVELEYFAHGKSWGLKTPFHVGAANPLVTASWRPEFLTGLTPAIRISGVRQIIEPPVADENAPRDAGAAPVGVSGKLHAPQAIDRYLIGVTAGVKYRFDIRGARLRSPIDAQIIVRNEQGGELARADDQPGTTDPALEIDAPAGATKLLIEVRDTQGGGGEGFVYHLEATPLNLPAFSLTTDVDRLAIPRGGLVVTPIQIARRNYAGPLQFSLASSPAGVTVAAADIPADADIALVAFAAAADANGAGVSRISAKSTAPETALVSEVVRGAEKNPVVDYQPNLRKDFAVAAVDAAPLAVVWQKADVDLLGDMQAVRCQLQLTRAAGLAGKTRIRLLTSQVQPKKTIKENNQDKIVDDVEKTLRLEGETVFAADATAVTVTLRVPADLPPKQWQVAFVAEVLSADDKAVVAAAPCLPRTMKLTGP